MTKKIKCEDYIKNNLIDPLVNCPICGNPLVEEEGVTLCYYCGWCESEDE